MLSLVWILIIQNNKVLLKMRTKILLIVLVSVLCSFRAWGQTTVVTYSYDAAGNRTSRENAPDSLLSMSGSERTRPGMLRPLGRLDSWDNVTKEKPSGTFFLVMNRDAVQTESQASRIPVAKDPYRVSPLSYDLGQVRVALAATDCWEIRKRGER